MIYEMKQPSNNKNSDESAISIGSIAFYYTQNELRCAHERVIVTSRQAEILRMLATHPNHWWSEKASSTRYGAMTLIPILWL